VPEFWETKVDPFTTQDFDVPPAKTKLTVPVPLPPPTDNEIPVPTVALAGVRVSGAWLRARKLTTSVTRVLK
jgi:hypothetical protein